MLNKLVCEGYLRGAPSAISMAVIPQDHRSLCRRQDQITINHQDQIIIKCSVIFMPYLFWDICVVSKMSVINVANPTEKKVMCDNVFSDSVPLP